MYGPIRLDAFEAEPWNRLLDKRRELWPSKEDLWHRIYTTHLDHFESILSTLVWYIHRRQQMNTHMICGARYSMKTIGIQ